MFFTLPGSLPSAHNGEMLESAQTGLERGFSSSHFLLELLLFWSQSTIIFESNLRSLLSEILYQFPLWAEKAHKSTSVSAWIYLSSTTSLNLNPTCHRCISSDSLCSEQNHRGRLGWLRHRLESWEEIWRLLKQHCSSVLPCCSYKLWLHGPKYKKDEEVKRTFHQSRVHPWEACQASGGRFRPSKLGSSRRWKRFF